MSESIARKIVVTTPTGRVGSRAQWVAENVLAAR
jgi:hypothetical protein